MQHFLSEVLNGPSNALHPFLSPPFAQPLPVLLSGKPRPPNFPECAWQSQPGNGQGTLRFPEGTVVSGVFKQFALQLGRIVFPGGVVFEGVFASEPRTCVGLFQRGQVSFPDGQVLLLENRGLSVQSARLLDREGRPVLALGGEAPVRWQPSGAGLAKFFDLQFYFSVETREPRTNKIIEEKVYSYFGLYYSGSAVCSPDGKFFQTHKSVLAKSERVFPADFAEARSLVERPKELADSLLAFRLLDFPGHFVLQADSLSKFACGKGFYRSANYKEKGHLLVADGQLKFIFRNRLLGIAEAKRRLLEWQGEFNLLRELELGESFADIEERPGSPARSLEEKYLGLIENMSERFGSEAERIQREIARWKEQVEQLLKVNERLASENTELLQDRELADKSAEQFCEELDGLIGQHNRLCLELRKIKEQNFSLLKEKRSLEKANNSLKEIYDAKEQEFYALAKNFLGIENQRKKELEEANKVLQLFKEENQRLRNSLEQKQSEESFKIVDIEFDDLRRKQSLDKAINARPEEREQAVHALSKNCEVGTFHQPENQEKATEAGPEALFFSFSEQESGPKNLPSKLKELELIVSEKSQSIEGLKKMVVQTEKLLRESEGRDYTRILEFKGAIFQGKKQGVCLYKTAKYSYEGNFLNDLFSGQGRLRLERESKVFEGEFENGLFKGRQFRWGRVGYHGGVLGNDASGAGALEFENEFIVEGRFEAGGFVEGELYTVSDLKEGMEEFGRPVLKEGKWFLRVADEEAYAVDFEGGRLVKLVAKQMEFLK